MAHNHEAVGSNPTPATIWPLRLSVRTSPFHGDKAGFDSHRGHQNTYAGVAQLAEQFTRNE